MIKSKNDMYWVYVVVFLIVSYFLLDRLFELAAGLSPIVSEMLSAFFGSIITVAAMSIMIKTQYSKEKEKEFSSRLFEKKLELYQDLVFTIFKADDNNVLSKSEIQDIENKIGRICLLAHEDLVSVFSQFLYQIKVYGVLYFRSMDDEQIKHFVTVILDEKSKENIHDSLLARVKYELELPVSGYEEVYFVSLDDFIQAMRVDLAVVEGDVQQEIEHFVTTRYDAYGMMRHPNIIDK